MDAGLFFLAKFLIANNIWKRYIKYYNEFHNRNISTIEGLINDIKIRLSSEPYDEKPSINELIYYNGFSLTKISFNWGHSSEPLIWGAYNNQFHAETKNKFHKLIFPLKLNNMDEFEYLMSELNNENLTDDFHFYLKTRLSDNQLSLKERVRILSRGSIIGDLITDGISFYLSKCPGYYSLPMPEMTKLEEISESIKEKARFLFLS